MATFSVTTTAAQDAAAQRYVDFLNKTKTLPTDPDITALAFARSLITGFLDNLIAKYASDDRETKAELYMKASDADKATIDAILQKYQA